PHRALLQVPGLPAMAFLPHHPSLRFAFNFNAQKIPKTEQTSKAPVRLANPTLAANFNKHVIQA
ncbi:hypothetical protein, partial [Pseudomonas sp. FW507-12TSA]|uniref:hypothetical protein n=1 Tax=Pseudomonas sp. FW507-12TSA TaxID=2075552 RepID=UPI001C467311